LNHFTIPVAIVRWVHFWNFDDNGASHLGPRCPGAKSRWLLADEEELTWS
jgi:hypothetical protein